MSIIRYSMLKMAIAGIEGLGIETIELECRGVSYTYDTMKLLKKKSRHRLLFYHWCGYGGIIFQNGIRLMNSLLWFSLLAYNVHVIKLGLPTRLPIILGRCAAKLIFILAWDFNRDF